MGVIGSYLLDKYEKSPDYFRFKHHYVLHAMESEILCGLLEAIGEKQRVELKVFIARYSKVSSQTVIPLKIYVSAQNARRYLLAYNYRFKRIIFYRLDNIKALTLREPEPEFEKYSEKASILKKNLWGVSIPARDAVNHIEIDIIIEDGEEFILQRLEREKRNGMITFLGGHLYRFAADVYDAVEMLPWIRTFIGRISALRCDNDNVTETFYKDLNEMDCMYGVNDNVIL